MSRLTLPFPRQKAAAAQAPAELPVLPAAAWDAAQLPERSKKSRLGPQEGFMPLRPDFANEVPASGLARGRRNVAEACETGSGHAEAWLLEPDEDAGAVLPSHEPDRPHFRESSASYPCRSYSGRSALQALQPTACLAGGGRLLMPHTCS